MYRSQRGLLILALCGLLLYGLVWQARKVATTMHARREMIQLLTQAQELGASLMEQQHRCQPQTSCKRYFSISVTRRRCDRERCEVDLVARLANNGARALMQASLQQLARCEQAALTDAAQAGQGQTASGHDGCFPHLRIKVNVH